MPRRVFLPAYFVVVVALASGCGARKADVAGKIIYKEKPVSGGTVQLETEKGELFTCQTGTDGSYEFKKVPYGKSKIRIELIDSDRSIRYYSALSAQGPGRGTKEGAPKKVADVDPSTFSLIPFKYSAFATSELAVEVNQKKMDYPITLTD